MRNIQNSIFGRAALAAAILAGLLMFPGAARLRADDDCQRRIAKADHKLHEAIEHHGYRSEEAEHRRKVLHEVREQCWKANHRWWDEHERRWHTERDWDEHDHDQDRDHR